MSATKRKVVRGGQKILGTLNSGTGDSLLTQATNGEVRKVPSIDPSTYLTTSLLSAKIFIGNAINIATAQTVTGAIVFSNTGVASIANNVIIDANIATNAAISYGKLSLTNSIVNNDISSSANIARSKLATGTPYSIVVNNSSGILSSQTVITPNRLIISDSNGLPIASSITSTQVSYIDPTSSIQNQLNNRLIFSSGITPSSGDLISYISGQWDRVPLGTAGQYLIVNAGATGVQWTTVPNGVPTGGTAGQFLNKIDATNFNAQWSTLTLGLITDVTASLSQVNALATGFYDATSSVQGQIDTKLASMLANQSIWVGNNINQAAPLAVGTNGYVLTVVGGLVTWAAVAGTGTVTSVAFSAGTTGLTISGSPITGSGTITINGGTLVTTNGGTGINSYITGDILYASASNILSKLGVGSNGQVLTLAAGIPSWTTLGTLSGLTTGRIPYASSSSSVVDSAFLTWDNSTKTLQATNAIISTAFSAQTINISSTSIFGGKISVTQTSTTAPINIIGFTSDPSSPSEGDVGYNTTSHLLKFYNGTSWVSTSGGGGISGLTTNRIPYATSSTTLGDSANLSWDNTNAAITIATVTIHAKAHTSNLYIGSGSGNFTLSGIDNTCVGYTTGNALTTGEYNTLIGSQSGTFLTTGRLNTFLGALAGNAATTGQQNVAIGYWSNLASPTASNQLVIQNIIYGVSNSGTDTTISTGFIGIGQKSPTYQLHITGNAANKNLFLIEEDGGVNIFEVIESSGVNKISFFAATPVAQQSVNTILINNVTSGGSLSTIADFTSLTTYSTDAATIRNNFFRLAEKVLKLETALRNYGLAIN